MPNTLIIDVALLEINMAQELQDLKVTPGVALGDTDSAAGLLRHLDDTVRRLGLDTLRRRWSAACSELTNDAFGVDFKAGYTVKEFSSEQHSARIMQLCREEGNFFLPQVEAICDSSSGFGQSDTKVGLVFVSAKMGDDKQWCSAANAPVIGFAFFSLGPYRSIGGRQTCHIHLHYLLVSSQTRGQGVGSQMLDHVRLRAETKYPGHTILVDLESKNTPGAKKFWFTAQGFQIEANTNDPTGPVPGSKVYAPHFLLQELGTIRNEGVQAPAEDSNTFLDFL